MERFVPVFDESDEPHYGQLRANPEWNRIYDLIRHGYWHVTSVRGWDEIRLSGAIKPNVNGRFPKRFGDITDRSYAYKYGFVALFDFITPTDREVMRQWGNAWDVIVNTKMDQILLQFDRARLEPKVIPNSEAWGRSDKKILGGCIPFVEVWYPEEISTDTIVGVYRIPATSQFDFLPVLLNAGVM